MGEDHVQLAKRCLSGEADALRAFVLEYQQQVFALCLRMLGHRQDAEDTTQDSLLRAVKYLGSWDSGQPLTPWVMKIAANRCRTVLGQRAKRPSLANIEQLGGGAPEEGGLLGEELQLALNVLQEHYRTCFVLFYQQEMSILEISEFMQVPSGTVKTWLHRSRKLLAEHLRDRGLDPNPESASN